MKGVCYICNKTFSKAGITKHLKTHLKDDGYIRLYHIRIAGFYDPQYWLHIEIPADAKLKDLDKFLRDIWLECCDHLSAFVINDVYYVSIPEGEKDMNFKLGSVLNIGMEFYHLYDFGSQTKLRLKIMGERNGTLKEKVRILARNNPPKITCSCGEKAKWICTQCFYDSEENCYLCERCAKEHKCEEEMLLPVVNSPRMGVCGYAGGIYD
ncbi:hypothetical protein [Thermodesulfatator atlanticus]|uniref:hypothetical protein n=1 Tax=Thermodesulfatator atlanticus TaxID=501497 RepID=UPI0003B580BB|nr:hypothetical protein [Thermodesulfatator atlanticus]